MSRHVPTINTARITLRAMRPEDFERFAEIWAMPEVVRFIGNKPRSRDVAWDAFLKNAGQWQMSGFGQWAVEDHATKAMVGQTGFFHRSRNLGDDFGSYPEAGWVLSPEAQNKGFGTEAAQAAHDWYDRVVTGPLACMVDPENEASLKLAEKLGYESLRDAEYDNDPVKLLLRKCPP